MRRKNENFEYTNFEPALNPDEDIENLNREIDNVIDQEINPKDDCISIEEVGHKINKICDDIKLIVNMTMINVPDIQVNSIIPDSDYFEYSDMESSLINVLKQQTIALQRIIDKLDG
jgi:hypothetical protein